MSQLDRARVDAPRTSFLALGCVGALASLPAHAQDQAAPQSATNLGGMTVTDTAIDEGSYKTERLDSPKYTAPLVDTPRSITVIPQQLIKDTASATLAEALRTVPGITMGAGEGGNPIGDRPFIRGFDSSASTYIDGVRDLAAQVRETFDVDSIEVVKGSDTVTNGSGNAGGSINIVSKKPSSERFIAVDGSYGSADYKRATVDINQPINDFVGVRLNAMYHDQNIAGRNDIWQKRWGIAPSVKIGLTGPTSLTFDFYHLHSSELPDSGIPYYTTLANQPDANSQTTPASTAVRPRGAFYGLVDRDFRHIDTNEAGIRFEHAFDNGFKLRNTASYTHVAQDYLWSQPDDSFGNVFNHGTVYRRALSRYATESGLVDQADLSGKFDTGGLKHSIAASLEYSWQKSGYGAYVSNAAANTSLPRASDCPTPGAVTAYNCTSLANPTPHDPWTGTIVRSLPNTRTLARSSTYSAALYDTITAADWLLFNLGGRYDHYDTDASTLLTGATARTRLGKTDDLWTYSAGIVLKPRPNGSIYFSTGTAAVPPGSFLAQGSEDNALTTAGLTANDLKVQKTTSYELGTKWNLFDDNLALTVDAFQTRTTNARTANPDGTVSYVGTRRIRGAEISYNGNVTDKWNVFGGFTYMPSKVTDAGLTRTTTVVGGSTFTAVAPAAATGHPFPNTPKYSFTTFTNYKITPKLTLGGGAIYMGRVYGGFSDLRAANPDGTITIAKTRATYVPHYWRFDANASYELIKGVTLKVDALNLTNKLYYDQAYATHYAHQAAGRTVIGTIALRY
jgi:catecholate siderophore receptor